MRFSSPLQHSTLGAQPQSLVGREPELARLQSIFERTLRGERQIVFVTGEAGIGKTTLAMSGAKERKQDLYVFQCTADTRPEDLLITPVLAESGSIAYHASPLVTAVLTGSICVLDEGNRMNEKSWASLASLL